MNWNGTRVAVTGATGFIGQHLCEKLETLGADISVLLLDGENTWHRFQNEKMFFGNVSDFQTCLRFIGRSRPEVVFHLAAQPLVDTALDSPLDTFESNIRGAYNLLESIRLFGKNVKSIVWISTDKVYEETEEALTPSSPLDGTGHPYDASKLCGDVLAQTYAKTYHLPITIFRHGNVYGPGDINWDRLIPGTIRALLDGETVKLRSDGSYVRDYIYVEDIIDAYLISASRPVDSKGLDIFTVGSVVPYSARSIVRTIVDLMGKGGVSKIEILNTARNELHYQHLETSGLGKELTNIAYGLEKTIKWYKENQWMWKHE